MMHYVVKQVTRNDLAVGPVPSLLHDSPTRQLIDYSRALVLGISYNKKQPPNDDWWLYP